MTHTNEQERPPEFAQGSSAETQKATPHTGEQHLKIALWGGPGSGKTTFLAALRVAMLRDQDGKWNMMGRDDLQPGSAAFFDEGAATLRDEGRFPPATEGRNQPMVCTVSGILNPERWRQPVWFKRCRQISFDLYVQDYPGGTLRTADYNHALWSYLADCTGFIYLYDPQLDAPNTTNFAYLDKAIDFVASVVYRRSGAKKQFSTRLPHYVAICITKFDHPDTLKRLDAAGLVVWEANGDPAVPDADAAFRLLAHPDLVARLERSFEPARIRYFVTSSIGFYRQASGQVDREDLYNMVPGENRLRGDPHPINIVEPLIWITGQAQPPSLLRAIVQALRLRLRLISTLLTWPLRCFLRLHPIRLLLILSIILGTGIWGWTIYDRNQRYQQGIVAMENRQWDTARQRFVQLDDFRDAQTRWQEATYQRAQELMATGDLPQARHLFTTIPSYQDSHQLWQEVTYRIGRTALEDSDWETARHEFAQILDYADALNHWQASLYQLALLAITSEDWQRAAVLVSTIQTHVRAYADLPDLLATHSALVQALAQHHAASWQTGTVHEVAALPGHTANVVGLAVSPNGQYLTSGSWDGSIRRWDTTTMTARVITESCSRGGYPAFAFSADGQLAACGGDDSIQVWNLDHGTLFRRLSHTSNVLSLTFHPDSQRLAVGSRERIQLWNVAQDTLLHTQETPLLWGIGVAVTTSLAFSPDGTYLVSGGADNTLRLWRMTDIGFNPVEPSGGQGHQDIIWGLAVSPDSRSILSGGWDRQLRLWTSSGTEQRMVSSAHQDWIWSVAFSPDGQTIASSSQDGTIKLWRTENGEHIQTLTGGPAVPVLAFSPDGAYLASGSGSLKVISKRQRTEPSLDILPELLNRLADTVFGKDLEIQDTGRDDNTIRLWQPER